VSSLHLLQTAPRAKPSTDNLALAEKDSYSLQGKQLLNNIVKSMQIQSDPVVVPSKELIDLIQAVRTFLTKKATANSTTSFLIQLSNSGKSDWVNDNITRVKDYAQRNFVDF
jgi:hypothetical protein